MSLSRQAKDAIFARFGAAKGQTLGLAVSGGGDSIALAALAAQWADGSGTGLAAVTIDHGLRKESAHEAQRVSSFCAELGIHHTTLTWDDWDGHGNLQDQARRARVALITDWAVGLGIDAIATGHTQDDQAETVLLRLARGSGVDGLSAMARVREKGPVTWHRPLLDVSRGNLRDYLAGEGLPWIDDPSNEDRTFDRVKARQALDVLGELGIDRAGLAATADRMQSARHALELGTSDLGKSAAQVDRGDVILDWTEISQAPMELQFRLISQILMWVSGAEYRPRAQSLAGLIAAMEDRKTTVLSGCQISPEGSHRRVTRELAVVRDMQAPLGQIWDNRWEISGPATRDATIRALGDDGIRACPDWRESGLPRPSLIASPSVWSGPRLIAAPLAGFGREWRAKLVSGRNRPF